MNVRRELTLDVTPHDVYCAWLTPDLLRRWLGPGDITCTEAEVDERVGGRYRIFQADGDRPVGGYEAEILELVPDRRIVWRWGMAGPEREAGPIFDSLLTVTIEPDGDGARMTLTHERLEELFAAMPELADQFGPGWDDVLHKMAVLLKG
jgi:uncharacterized protein YndB with AHSA1/START domain